MGAMLASCMVLERSPPKVSRVRLKKTWALKSPPHRSLSVREAETVSTRLPAGSPSIWPRWLLAGRPMLRSPGTRT
ncbi:hypothetical protein D3C71_869310 [compost metagenome]